MAMRKSVPLDAYEQLAVLADKHKVKAQLERKRYRAAMTEIASLKVKLEAHEKNSRAQERMIQDHSGHVAELHRIIDQLKRENERLRLARNASSHIPGNLGNIDSRVWDGMWARTVSGGSAGTIGR